MVASARRWMQVRSRFGGSNLRVFPPDGLCLISKYGQDLDIGARGKEYGVGTEMNKCLCVQEMES